MDQTTREEFTGQITEKFREVEMLCLKYKVPCFMTCALEGDNETEYLHMTKRRSDVSDPADRCRPFFYSLFLIKMHVRYASAP